MKVLYWTLMPPQRVDKTLSPFGRVGDCYIYTAPGCSRPIQMYEIIIFRLPGILDNCLSQMPVSCIDRRTWCTFYADRIIQSYLTCPHPVVWWSHHIHCNEEGDSIYERWFLPTENFERNWISLVPIPPYPEEYDRSEPLDLAIVNKEVNGLFALDSSGPPINLFLSWLSQWRGANKSWTTSMVFHDGSWRPGCFQAINRYSVQVCQR